VGKAKHRPQAKKRAWPRGGGPATKGAKNKRASTGKGLMRLEVKVTVIRFGESPGQSTSKTRHPLRLQPAHECKKVKQAARKPEKNTVKSRIVGISGVFRLEGKRQTYERGPQKTGKRGGGQCPARCGQSSFPCQARLGRKYKKKPRKTWGAEKKKKGIKPYQVERKAEKRCPIREEESWLPKRVLADDAKKKKA